MKNIYDYIDGKFLAGANKLVKAYNWTTGGTKTDLANKFLDSAWISYTLGATAFAYNYQEKGFLVYLPVTMLSPFLLISTHFQHKKNLENEKLEEKAQMNGLKDYLIERNKEELKEDTLKCSIGSTFCGSTGFLFPHPELQFGVFLSGHLICAHNYIIRADNLPPRKNVFSRAKDKVKKYFEEKSKSPSGNPLPEPAFCMNKKELTDYI